MGLILGVGGVGAGGGSGGGGCGGEHEAKAGTLGGHLARCSAHPDTNADCQYTQKMRYRGGRNITVAAATQVK